jgi:hypothetical protein
MQEIASHPRRGLRGNQIKRVLRNFHGLEGKQERLGEKYLQATPHVPLSNKWHLSFLFSVLRKCFPSCIPLGHPLEVVSPSKNATIIGHKTPHKIIIISNVQV